MNINYKKYAPKKGYVLCLKSVKANMEAYNSFIWPKNGICEATDFKPTSKCGNGLHGFLWGAGAADLRCKDEDANWLIMSVQESDIINLGDKVKFPLCEVLYCGDRDTAVAIIQHFAPQGTPVMFGTATAGDSGTATAGDSGTATAGDSGTATAGDRGTATAGDRGTATAGDSGTATAGYSGTATAGIYGFICIEYFDKSKDLFIKKMAFVDNVVILAGVKYRLNETAEFEPVTE